jgi:hypothetical protein
VHAGELLLLFGVTGVTLVALLVAGREFRRVRRRVAKRLEAPPPSSVTGAEGRDLAEYLSEERRSLSGAGYLGVALSRILVALGGALCLMLLSAQLSEGRRTGAVVALAVLGIASVGALGCRKLGQLARQMGQKRCEEVTSLARRLLG